MADENMTENATFNLGNSATPEGGLPAVQDTPPGMLSKIGNQAPAGYEPGYSAPARREYEDSFTFKIGSALASWGEQMPVNMKLRLAQDQADIEQSRNQLAWANYHQVQETSRRVAQEHNQNMMFKMFEAAPSIKGRIASITDPAERQVAADWYEKWADSLSPGSGKVFKHMGKSPSTIMGMDRLLKSDTPGGKAARELTNTLGYENVATNPILNKLVEQQSKDLIPIVVSRFTDAETKQLIAGKMDQTAFRKAFHTAAMDESFGSDPLDIAYAQNVIEEPHAQGTMAAMGVQLDSSAIKMQQKEKPAGEETLSGIKAKEYNKLKNRVALAEQDPEAFAPAHVADMKKQMGILLGTESKDQGSNPNNMVNQRLQIISKGAVADVESIAGMPPGKAKEQAYAWAVQARKEQDQASGMGSLTAKMATPGDTSNYILADKLLSTGHAIPVRENVTEGELRTNKNFLKVTPEQKKELRELNVSIESTKQIFESAEEAFKGDFSKMGLSAAELAMTSEESALTLGPKLLAKQSYPKLAEYVARRESTLGKFARSVSGEVGVLTDKDVGRIRNMFPTATDTKTIRKSKEKSIHALIELNRKFAVEVLAGELSPDEIDTLKRSDKYKNAAQGILGSAEGVSKLETVETVRGESLLEKMRKGK